ncbi:hypothetical protein D3C77_154680 [compost metagenome]
MAVSVIRALQVDRGINTTPQHCVVTVADNTVTLVQRVHVTLADAASNRHLAARDIEELLTSGALQDGLASVANHVAFNTFYTHSLIDPPGHRRTASVG